MYTILFQKEVMVRTLGQLFFTVSLHTRTTRENEPNTSEFVRDTGRTKDDDNSEEMVAPGKRKSGR